MAEEGFRVLAFGEGAFTQGSRWRVKIVGLVGFYDPPKQGVKEAVLQAKKAGIKVIMITGDHPLTAKTIAKEVGIYNEGEEVLTGTMIASMQDEEIYQKLQKNFVLARILPEHKYRIVKILQERNEIVAMTGDGVNDVPALKAANLGIAMGSGTEAARSVAKMVLQDNNLKVLVDAIKNGRIFSDNIRKALYFLISAGIEEITLISLSIFANLPLPLTPLQILWINLVATGSQDKTFAFAKEEPNVMTRKPKDPKKQFFDSTQIFRVFYFSIPTGVVLFFLFGYLLKHFSYHHAVSLVFTSVIFTQWCNGILAQKENEPFFKNIKRSFTINPMIFLGTFIGLILQMLVLYAARDWFQIQYIRQEQWIYPIFMTLFVFLLLEARKWAEWIFLKIKNNRSDKVKKRKKV
jgi:Ca2+-transporting ATPase